MFKSSIWLMGLVVFLITNSRLASPSAILEYRSTVVPDIDEIKVLEESREFTSQETQPAEIPNPTTPTVAEEPESEPPLVGEYYDAPEAVLTDTEYIVDSSKPESGEVPLEDGDHLQDDHDELVPLKNSKLLAALMEDSHTTQQTLRNSVSAEIVSEAPVQIETDDVISEEPNTIADGEESINLQENDEPINVVQEKKETINEVENEEPINAVENEEPINAVENEEPINTVENEEPINTVENEEPINAGENEESINAVENEEPINVVEEEEPINVIEKEEPINVVEEEEPIIVVVEEQSNSEVKENDGPNTEVEESENPNAEIEESENPNAEIEEIEKPNAEIEENENPNAEIEEIEKPNAEIEESENPNAEIEKFDEPIIDAIKENEEPVAVIEATEEPNMVHGEIEEVETVTEGTVDPNTVTEVLYNQEDSEEHTEASLEEPDSTEKALEKEVNAIVAAMAAKNDLAKAKGTDAPLEVVDLEGVDRENLLPTPLPEQSHSKEFVSENELVGNELEVKEDEKEEGNLENTVIGSEESTPTENLESVPEELLVTSESVVDESAPTGIIGGESLVSKILAVFSTQTTPEELSSTGEENDGTETILAINPTTLEGLTAEPDKSEDIVDNSSTLSNVFNKVRLISKVLLAFSTQATPEEVSPTEVALENGETEAILEINRIASEILTTEPVSESDDTADDSGALSKVLNKVRLISKVLLAFSTQSTPEENNQTEAIVELNSGELISGTVIPTEVTLEESVDDSSVLSGVFNKVRQIKKVLSMFSTEATPEANDSAGDGSVENNNPTEVPLIILDISGASLIEPSEIPLKISSSENDANDVEEIPSETVEPTVSVLSILPNTDSSEGTTGGENDVAGPLEASGNIEQDEAENTMSERDAEESPVIFEADDDNKSDGLGNENENRIQFMESKMTVTFVNDGDDYANDAVEGSIVAIIPDDESDETTPSPDAAEIIPDANDDATPSPDANEEDDGETTAAPIIKSASSSESSSSSESNEDSSKSSSSESDEETVKLELPMPTDSAETGSTTAPEINSGESDEDVNTTAAANTEAEDAETLDDGESEEQSDSEKILNAVVDDLIKAVAGKPETVDSPAASAATIINFDRTTIIVGAILMCLSLMSFQEF